MDLKNKIKCKLLGYYSQKNLKKSKLTQNISFDSSLSIGVLFTLNSEFDFKILKNFCKKLDLKGKMMHIIGFNEAKVPTFKYNYDIIEKEEITFTGKILNKKLTLFLNQKFDYLFFMNFDMNPYVGYIISKCEAKCKVGYFSKKNSPFLDIMVKFNRNFDASDIDELLNMMIRYVKVL